MLYERLQGLPRILAVLGHPDPRLARKGLGRDGSLGDEDDDLASQQGEILLRGLAKLREDFVFLVTAQHIGWGVLSESLAKMAQTASHYASRQRGALSRRLLHRHPPGRGSLRRLLGQPGQEREYGSFPERHGQ